MQTTTNIVEEYLNENPEERKEGFLKLQNTIFNNLPKRFQEEISYGLLSFVVPHSH